MMNLKKLSLGLVALVGFGLVVVMQSAFTINKTTDEYSYWQYDLNTQTGDRVGTNYTLISDPESPGCDEGTDLPCVIRVEKSIDTQGELSTYLTSNFSTEAAVTASAFHKKLMD